MNRMKSVLLVSGLVYLTSPTITLAQDPGLERWQRLLNTEPPEFCSVVASGLSKMVAPFIDNSKWESWSSQRLFQIDLAITKLDYKLGRCFQMDMKAGRQDLALDDLIARSTIEELLITISKAELVATWKEDDKIITQMYGSVQTLPQRYKPDLNQAHAAGEEAADAWWEFEKGVAAGSTLTPVCR